MEFVITKLGQPLYDNNNHKGYLIKWILLSPLCKKWSRNRDSDLGRVSEMFEYYRQGGHIPTQLHLADLRGEGLVCYDGNHRREVFDRCLEFNPDLTCLVDIMFKTTQNEVFTAFNNINKSVQLPAIYLGDAGDTSDIKIEIIKLVKTYENKYKQFVSTSSRYHAPNFNRDCFVDNIHSIYIAFNATLSVEKIGHLLDLVNQEYGIGNMCRPHTKYKASVLEKCKKHNFWLFLDRSIPFEHVETAFKNLNPSQS